MLRAADLILHTGDFTSRAVYEELEALGRVAAVAGNMDEWPLREELPERHIVEEAGLRIGLIHDAGPSAGRHDRLRNSFPGCDVIVYGHTHLPEASDAEGVWIVNPGSPTERRRAPSHTMAVLQEGRPTLVEL